MDQYMLDYGAEENWQWVSHIEVAQFTVDCDGKPIICRVSRDCLDDHCGNPDSPGAYLDAAKRNFDHITDKVGYLITIRRFETNGTILLRSSDW